jgi:transposase
VQRLRRAFQKRVRSIPAAKLVFVDESGATTSMTRTHGRAPPGERVVDTVPLGHWTVMTMLGAVRLEGPVAVMTVEAATDAEIFRSFVDAALIPSLHQGDVVVWDNLGPHRTVGLEPMLQAVGASLLPLPPYSPDLSPIEPGWSKVKEHLRTVKPRTPQALGKAAGEAFATITAEDAKGWFSHCGYAVH